MKKENEVVCFNHHDLLDIFPSEQDKMGQDLLLMSNFYGIFVNKLESKIDNSKSLRTLKRVSGLTGKIATAIQTGYDISKSGILIADYSHFSQDIINGLKKGIYHIGQSREVSGNLRPAILDKDEQLVKFFTLKKSYNASNILADISTMSFQMQLQQISMRIENMAADLDYLVKSDRRINLSNKLIYARDKIMLAYSSESKSEMMQYLKEADTYLMEGLTNLYVDLNEYIKTLGNNKSTFTSIDRIDAILFNIFEDMQMIPRYVALRAYLFNYQRKSTEVYRIIKEYKYQIKSLNDNNISNGKNSAFEIIHKYYRYDNENLDFWLKEPVRIIKSIDLYEKILESKSENFIYIQSEEK